MQQMKFSKLSLLSQRERRALQVEFWAPQTVLVAGNGFGKSAILKSLYETLGAKPHKIDARWKGAQVMSLLEFTIGQKRFSILKLADSYTVFNATGGIEITTNRIMAELAPYLANLLDFRLVLADKKEEIRIPPPSYAFAPYYVDQDGSWQKAWNSFTDLSMFSHSSQSLAEYHSGLRPNAYYEAKATRDQAKAELATIDAERNAVHNALTRIREEMPATPISLNLEAFSTETDRLVAGGQSLHNEQARYRSELAALNEEYHLWIDHVAVVESALKELDASFEDVVDQPTDVECPMCGQHYTNHIAEQFALKADKDDLMIALQTGRTHLRQVQEQIAGHKRKMEGVSTALEKVQQILAIKREDITLRDVVQAEGRTEAQRYLQRRLAELDTRIGEKQRSINQCEQRMKDVESRDRKGTINSKFQSLLVKCALDLDVRLPPDTRGALQGLHIGRGSEGPRALAAYYYAFLHTARQFATATFCPIVIDAPNQQGQDQGHLQRIMQFLLSESPPDSQVIIGAETVGEASGANIVDVTFKKDQVLREDQYEAVLAHVRPFLIQATLP